MTLTYLERCETSEADEQLELHSSDEVDVRSAISFLRDDERATNAIYSHHLESIQIPNQYLSNNKSNCLVSIFI